MSRTRTCALFLLVGFGCASWNRVSRERADLEASAAELYGPTSIMIYDLEEDNGVGWALFWRRLSVGRLTCDDQLDEKRMAPLVRLYEAGSDAIPLLYEAMQDDREIPCEWVASRGVPVRGLRVQDKAAYVFSAITGIELRLSEAVRVDDGAVLLVPLSVERQDAVMRQAYELVRSVR